MAGYSISDEDIRKVREANDLVSVIGSISPVRQRGRDFWCCCPLHSEKTPSLRIDTALQLWHCFGCDEGGDVFAFVMKMDGLSFPEAVRKLAERANIEITETMHASSIDCSEKGRLKEICKETAEYYHLVLKRDTGQSAADARAYLSSRGFGSAVASRWMLGYAPGSGKLVRHLRQKGFTAAEMVKANVAVQRESGSVADRFYNRIMFPIRDIQGDCIAFGGRIIGSGEPKYLNTQETPLFHKSKVLYGLDQAKSSMATSGLAIVVEGYTDVISLSEAGICNVVATLGTALTRQHIRLLSRHAKHGIVYLFDGDAAGQRAADRALNFVDETLTPEASQSSISLSAVTLPDNLDPAEFIAQRGKEALETLLKDAKPLIQYGIDRRLETGDLSSPEGRTRAFTNTLSILAPIKESLLAKDYAVQIASRTHMREQDALDALAKLSYVKPRSDEGYRESTVSTFLPYKNDPAFENSPSSSGDPSFLPLNAATKNRISLERELLSLLARHPSLLDDVSGMLATLEWHSPLHRAIAEKMLTATGVNVFDTSADFITWIQRFIPETGGLLTSGALMDLGPEGFDISSIESARNLIGFLMEEMSISDTENEVAALKVQLKDLAFSDEEERDCLFQTIVGMQRDIASRREALAVLFDKIS